MASRRLERNSSIFSRGGNFGPEFALFGLVHDGVNSHRKTWWRRRELNPRPRKPAMKRLRAFPIRWLSAAALEPARKRRLSPIVVSLLLLTEALGPILENDAHWMPSRPSTRGGYLVIRQRMQTACWQFWFSDRFTGARNPARLSTTIQSRRIRCAPLSLHLTI